MLLPVHSPARRKAGESRRRLAEPEQDRIQCPFSVRQTKRKGWQSLKLPALCLSISQLLSRCHRTVVEANVINQAGPESQESKTCCTIKQELRLSVAAPQYKPL